MQGSIQTADFIVLTCIQNEPVVAELEDFRPKDTSVIDGIEPQTGQTASICNSETVDVSGSKVLNDANDRDGIRSQSITVYLLADGEKIENVTVTEKDGCKGRTRIF